MDREQFIKLYGKEPSARELKKAQKYKPVQLFTKEDLAILKNIKADKIFVRKKLVSKT